MIAFWRDYTEGVMADFALVKRITWLAQYDIVHAAIWGHAEDAFQPYAAGKLTAFDFSDKWDSQLGEPGAASRFCLCLRTRKETKLAI